jgi:hypothetical protein
MAAPNPEKRRRFLPRGNSRTTLARQLRVLKRLRATVDAAIYVTLLASIAGRGPHTEEFLAVWDGANEALVKKARRLAEVIASIADRHEPKDAGPE